MSERLPGSDVAGYAGLEDQVDDHWENVAKAATLSTLLSIGSELASDSGNALLSALRNGSQDTADDAGQRIVSRELSVPPTVTIRPGFPVRVVVTRDLVIPPYGETP
ncbi:TrbI/VirB10 family protein [Zavarzinia sp.]|uniref:TrbI/VirB10 family protein n=1 Tax=Zavarzinia sp. TaxID=2027920 RepID=UPI003BB6EDF2